MTPENVLKCTGMYWNVLECTGMYWNVLECTGMYWNVLNHKTSFLRELQIGPKKLEF
jgi:hypothetical protein